MQNYPKQLVFVKNIGIITMTEANILNLDYEEPEDSEKDDYMNYIDNEIQYLNDN